mmetsp:Transcript_21008/g.62851  ORF Transcript_21008/g.62851 Transcript_21008/m.62851 type:complete len:101 (-) Transcript_21008:2350-2652(-)
MHTVQNLATRRSGAPAARRVAAQRPRLSSVVVRADGKINASIRKEEEKVVDFLKTDEMKGKAVMCRCWKSDKFPNCDGKHVAHNKDTGDNVGPLIVEKSA